MDELLSLVFKSRVNDFSKRLSNNPGPLEPSIGQFTNCLDL